MKKVTALDEDVIRDIGHAFGYDDYGGEHGLIDAFPGRDAAAAFICGYVRMALKSGMLYTTGKNEEGFIAYKLPGQKITLKAGLSLAHGFFGAMDPKSLIRFIRIMVKGGSGPEKRFDKEKSRISSSIWSACGRNIRGRDICASSWTRRSPRATGWACRCSSIPTKRPNATDISTSA